MSDFVNHDDLLEWDDDVQGGDEYIILPDGDYNFEVTAFERQRYSPKEDSKIPACNQAVLKIKIETSEGVCVITYNLFLVKKMEWKISEFFRSIGASENAEGKIRMDWNSVFGATGRAKIGSREYNGETRNEIKKFYSRDDKKAFKAGEF